MGQRAGAAVTRCIAKPVANKWKRDPPRRIALTTISASGLESQDSDQPNLQGTCVGKFRGKCEAGRPSWKGSR